jgi:hypothetical protein
MQSSKSGTRPTGRPKKHMTVPEVVSIINECGASGVSELKFGDLYVKFSTKAASNIPDPLPTVTEITESQKKNESRSLENDELNFREDQLANALLENPLLAEELLIKGELEKGVAQEND